MNVIFFFFLKTKNILRLNNNPLLDANRKRKRLHENVIKSCFFDVCRIGKVTRIFQLLGNFKSFRVRNIK